MFWMKVLLYELFGKIKNQLPIWQAYVMITLELTYSLQFLGFRNITKVNINKYWILYQISCYHDMLTLYHHDILQQMNNVISLWIKYTKWIPLSSWLSINLWYSISWSICFLKYTFLQTEYLLHLVVTKINKSVINLCYKNKTVFSANKRFLDLLDNSYQNNVGLKQIGRKPTRVILQIGVI